MVSPATSQLQTPAHEDRATATRPAWAVETTHGDEANNNGVPYIVLHKGTRRGPDAVEAWAEQSIMTDDDGTTKVEEYVYLNESNLFSGELTLDEADGLAEAIVYAALEIRTGALVDRPATNETNR